MNVAALIKALQAAHWAWDQCLALIDEYGRNHVPPLTRVQVLEKLRDAAIDSMDDSAAFHLEFWRERMALYEQNPSKAAGLMLTVTGMDPTYYAAWWKRRLQAKPAGTSADAGPEA